MPKIFHDIPVPQWIGRVYLVLSILLVPWIIYLAVTLPTHHRSTNWDVLWAGFDIGLLIALLCTAVTALVRSRFIIMTATASGTLLLVDAWFDLINEFSHSGFAQSLLLALVIELPLSCLSFYVAYRVLAANSNR